MGFLAHTGGLAKTPHLIVIDAVLTDVGRRRLASGDGTFNITKFAFGDDEIDYSLYDTSATTPTENQDDILMLTPTLEAVPDGFVGLRHSLFTAPDDDEFRIPQLVPTPDSATVLEGNTITINVRTDNNLGRPDSFYTVRIAGDATRYFSILNGINEGPPGSPPRGRVTSVSPVENLPENCFVAGTKVATKIGLINIEDIVNKDEVITYNPETEQYAYSSAELKVDKSHDYKKEKLYKFTFSNNVMVNVSAGHNVYTIENGWMKIGDIVDEEIMFSDGKLMAGVTIKSKEVQEEEPELYTLMVTGHNHNYFANGILAHNARSQPNVQTYRVRASGPNEAQIVVQGNNVVTDKLGEVIVGNSQKGPYGIQITGDTTGASDTVDYTWQNVPRNET